jgi:uncharacterized integral membrane protein (TIGR00698 family)
MGISIPQSAPTRARRFDRWRSLVPGLVVVVVVSALSMLGGRLEGRLFGRPIIEPLVLAILVGIAVRTARGGVAREAAGNRFAAKQLLEVSVLLLGATMDVPRLFASGPALAGGIVLVVCIALTCGFFVGRAIGLSPRLAVLVACGNAICGNSAIAAIAPVIGADDGEVAASIALAAVLGVIEILALPLLIVPFGLSHYQYGILAGLSVYAVPQVLAAAFAVSALSGQVATVVKLARVLMLGPVVVFLAIRSHRAEQASAAADREPRRGLAIGRVVPWFVIGFILLATLRSTGAIPDAAAGASKTIAGWLMIAAMAALGLAVDVGSVRRVGARVATAIGGSLVVLIALSIALIRIAA